MRNKTLNERKERLNKGYWYKWYEIDGKQVFRAVHRMNWELHHGRKIPDGWIVHHVNGDPLDNRPENLEAMPDEKHRRVIPFLESKIRELEALVKQLKDQAEVKNKASS